MYEKGDNGICIVLLSWPKAKIEHGDRVCTPCDRVYILEDKICIHGDKEIRKKVTKLIEFSPDATKKMFW